MNAEWLSYAKHSATRRDDGADLEFLLFSVIKYDPNRLKRQFIRYGYAAKKACIERSRRASLYWPREVVWLDVGSAE